MNHMLKHGLITVAVILAVGAGMFFAGWAMASGIAWLAVVAGLCGGAGLMAVGLFIFYFAD